MIKNFHFKFGFTTNVVLPLLLFSIFASEFFFLHFFQFILPFSMYLAILYKSLYSTKVDKISFVYIAPLLTLVSILYYSQSSEDILSLLLLESSASIVGISTLLLSGLLILVILSLKSDPSKIFYKLFSVILIMGMWIYSTYKFYLFGFDISKSFSNSNLLTYCYLLQIISTFFAYLEAMKTSYKNSDF